MTQVHVDQPEGLTFWEERGFDAFGGYVSGRYAGVEHVARASPTAKYVVLGHGLLVSFGLSGVQDGVDAIAWSPDGATIAAAGVVGGIGREERELYGPAGAPDRDERVFLFDAATGAQRDILKWREREHHALAYSPNGRILAVVGGTLFTLATTDGRGLIDQRPVGPGGSHAVAWRPDGRQVAYGDKARVRVLELAAELDL